MNTLLKLLLITCTTVVIPVHNLSAQTLAWEDFVERMTGDNDDEYARWEYLYDELAERHAHPFNLQTLTREQLETLPFLSPDQVESLLAYLYTYSPVLSLSELQLVEGLDYDTRQLLSLFVYVGEAEAPASGLSLRNIARYGKHEVTVRSDVPFYYRKGYYKYPADVLAKYPNRRYLGDPTYQSLRYRFDYGTRLSVGLTAEKDPGEPFFGSGNKGYDFYSGYVLLHDLGRLETLALGNYRLNFGQGLVMNTGFSLGKLSALNSLSGSRGIKAHSSTNEHDYLQGAAGTFRWGHFAYTAFYSFRQLDATLQDGLITSLKTDGYHRTPSEMEKKNNINNHLLGSNLTYRKGDLQIGLTGVYNLFNKVLKPSSLAYKHYDPSGRDFYALGVDYRYDRGRWSLAGETGWSQGGGMATLNSVRYRVSSSCRLLALHRYYAKNYGAMYARSFEEGGRVRNEHGLYLGVEALPWELCQLTAYVDLFRFPYRKYRLSVDGSQGWEGMLQLANTPYRKLTWLLRYQYKSRGQDFTTPVTEHRGTAARTTHKVKVQGAWYPWPWLRCKTTLNWVQTDFVTTGPERGYGVGEALSFASTDKRLQAELGGLYFCTDSYDARVYGYERGMLYAFSSSAYEGEGVRGYAWLRYDINTILTCLVKYGCTAYFDRNTISSGTQEIEGSTKYDLYLQLRIKF